MKEIEYSVPLKTVVEELGLEVVLAAPDYNSTLIATPDVNRPGLQLAGFYDYFDARRIQIIGIVETTYLLQQGGEARRHSLDTLMSSGIKAIVICHGVEIFPECLEIAKARGITLLATDEDTSEFLAQLIGVLKSHLARRITIHGVLVEVHGEGMLLMGESGVGKSETALELIKRGHRLIADDAVEIKRMSRTALVGEAPEIIRYYMELRGIGVINARNIYGIGAVKPSEKIDLIVNLELWDTNKAYDRLGIETEYTHILDVKVPYMTIPVRPGRNLAVILELAAMNNRQKRMGINNALELAESHDRSIDATGELMKTLM